MARYNGLIIPRSYNDYFSRSDPQAIRYIVALAADGELNAESKNPLQNQAIAKIVPVTASPDNKLIVQSQISGLTADVETIKNIIPNTASETNELADKNFVNSTVGTNTANYIYKTESGGEKVPFSSVAELEAYAGTVTNNDYAFVTGIDENGNTYYDRYKADVNDGVVTWAKEYRLNNSSFTAEQWAAIQSGITAEKVAQFEAAGSPGAPVGTLISQYKKVPMSGYLYCDGSTFDQNAYPALYMYLGTNVLPDYRECVMVGAEQNTTDTIATHDVYGEGEFKDDQLQNITVDATDVKVDSGAGHDVGMVTGGSRTALLYDFLHDSNSGRVGTTTHGKQKAVYVYIKATSGLAENQQENVLNDVKNYLAWNYKVVSCAGGASGNVEIPAGYNGNYEYSILDYKYHTSFHGIHIASDGNTTLGNIATNFGSTSNDGITLNNLSIGYNRESTAGDFRIAFRPIPNGIAI